jgi:NTP pyrophosphatase (non-canonical NTP hydrolase)
MHIHEFQELMQRLYFHRDSQRGVEKTFEWFIEEVAELSDALKSGNKKALESEFADVLAWLASLANLTNVNLEEATISKYDNKCPKCSKIPCQCPF